MNFLTRMLRQAAFVAFVEGLWKVASPGTHIPAGSICFSVAPFQRFSRARYVLLDYDTPGEILPEGDLALLYAPPEVWDRWKALSLESL